MNRCGISKVNVCQLFCCVVHFAVAAKLHLHEPFTFAACGNPGDKTEITVGHFLGVLCLHNTVMDAEGNAVIALVRFQKGSRNDPKAQAGVLDADLLEIVRDRLTAFNRGEFATRENACAITHIEEALMWMAKRADDRAERGVLGTYNK